MKYSYKLICCILLLNTCYTNAEENNNIIINGLKIEFMKNDTVIITNLTNKTIEPIIINDEEIEYKSPPNGKLLFKYKEPRNKIKYKEPRNKFKDEARGLSEEQKKALEELLGERPEPRNKIKDEARILSEEQKKALEELLEKRPKQ